RDLPAAPPRDVRVGEAAEELELETHGRLFDRRVIAERLAKEHESRIEDVRESRHILPSDPIAVHGDPHRGDEIVRRGPVDVRLRARPEPLRIREPYGLVD